ncbi:ABC transporter permease [Natrinema sp. SYSU A 869]|uniref:ABC transporter permease n=1 Tax=Natrinema sp. SYSU A 869 TaxID=2871694 RepID=UPI001CA39B64|nr:ABC transporter permease [Natrinema sp. SYSU A 869]
MHRETLENALFRAGYLAILTFMLLPLVVVVVTSFAESGQLLFPPENYSLVHYRAFLEETSWLSAFDNSLLVGVGTTVVATTLGVTAAFGHELDDGWAGQLLAPLVLVPLLIPPIILGISMRVYFVRVGMDASYLSIILAHTLWATPLVYFVMRSVFSRFDWQLLDAARDLGAGPIQSFVYAVLPNVKHGIFVGALLAFIVSLQEFVMALFLSSHSTETIPVVAWKALRQSLDPMVSVVSTFLILISVVAIVIATIATNLDWLSKQLS